MNVQISARALGATQVAVGVVMVAAPARLAALAAGRDAVAPTAVVRVLGAREIAQGVLTVARPSRSTLGLGAGADVLHLASMVPLAVIPRWRRTALASGGLAVAGAVVGVAGWRAPSGRR
jgi:hypothetical protein